MAVRGTMAFVEQYTCLALTRSGNRCAYRAVHASYCRMHARLRASAPEPEAVAEDITERRRQRIAEEIANAPHMPIQRIQWFLNRLVDVWIATPALRYVRVPLAYYNCIYVSQQHPGFASLIQAIVRIVRQTRGYHPSGLSYQEIPVEERREAIVALHGAVSLYDPVLNVRGEFLCHRASLSDIEEKLAEHMHFLDHEAASSVLRFHTIIARPLPDDETARFCPLLQDTIPLGGLYTYCEACKNVFDADAAAAALEGSRTCPLCRAPWIHGDVYQA
jgi:hypothetical protein